MAAQTVSEPRLKPGQAGEELACKYLERKGMRILDRNYRCRAGEIDVVARDGNTVVFVEVKERTGTSHGTAIESVTASKRARVVRAARLYAATHGLDGSCRFRFDVIAVDRRDCEAQVRHEVAAFDESGGG